MEKNDAAKVHMSAPDRPVLEELASFLRAVCADADSMREIEADLERTSQTGPKVLLRYLRAIEGVLAAPPPPGTLGGMVAWDGNVVLDDNSDVGTATWLKEMAERIRGILGEAQPVRPRGP